MNPVFASAAAQLCYEAMKELFLDHDKDKPDDDLGQIVYLLETISEKLDTLIALQRKGVKYGNINQVR